MDKGSIPINNKYELEFRYYKRDNSYKYFNRKFEVFLLKKKILGRDYIMHMDNSDKSKIMPDVYKGPNGNQRMDLGLSTLNWNDIKNNFLDFIVEEIGREEKEKAKKAINKLSSPKI